MKRPDPSGNSILVLGLGNEILTDDGIGPRLVHHLNKSLFSDNVTFSSVSLGGLELLEIIRNYNFVIILDAIKTGTFPVGHIECYTPSDFKDTLHLSNLHDIDFLTALELGRRIGMSIPCSIYIIAIEIEEDRVFSTSFSPLIEAKFNNILNQVEQMLTDLIMK